MGSVSIKSWFLEVNSERVFILKLKAKCGICHKFVKTEKIENGEKGEVKFVCKEHGDITSYVEIIKK